MKRNFLLIAMLFVVFTLSSCRKGDNVPIIAREGRQVAETSDENFRIILYSEKDVYSETEEVDIWATIEYIGSEDTIDIYSGEPYAGFTVTSGDTTFISTSFYNVLKTTTLRKGDVHEFPLRKAGGFSEDDEDADFWREFYSEEEMLFPVGEYQLTFATIFYTEDSSDFSLSVEYQFEVN